MADVLNPVDVETNIRACADEVHKGVESVSARELAARKARRDYDAALAKSYLNAGGTAQERKYTAELETVDLREAAEVAEASFQYAQRRAKAAEKRLSAWQSLGSSVRQMYGAETGVGR